MKKKENKVNKKKNIKIVFLIIIVIFASLFASLILIREVNHYIYVNNVIKIEKENNHVGCADVMNPVYANFFYVYESGDDCTINVFYKDGSSESLSKALYSGHIKISDLKRFNYSLSRRSIFDR